MLSLAVVAITLGVDPAVNASLVAPALAPAVVCYVTAQLPTFDLAVPRSSPVLCCNATLPEHPLATVIGFAERANRAWCLCRHSTVSVVFC